MSELLKNCQVDICVGAGGVGKTTVASVLGLHYALLGEKTLVITVDPARRLLDALGISRAGFSPKQVNVQELLGEEPKAGGSLSAFMPDLKKEWMSFLTASIRRDEIRHEISSNHFYQYMAEGLPGAFEIICSHVLFRLIESGKYDRIILDTPPSSHSLSFFDVPQKISAVLEQSIFRTLMSKRHSRLLKFTKKLAFISSGLMEKTLEPLMGSNFLSEVIDFALTIDSLYEPMLKRAQAMDELLKDKKTRYVLVLRPTTASISDSSYLHDSLKKRGVSINQVILNQVSQEVDLKALELEEKAMKDIPGYDAAMRVIHMYKDELALEKQLMHKLKQYSKTDTRKLYASDLLDRKNLLRNLLRDFNKELL